MFCMFSSMSTISLLHEPHRWYKSDCHQVQGIFFPKVPPFIELFNDDLACGYVDKGSSWNGLHDASDELPLIREDPSNRYA